MLASTYCTVMHQNRLDSFWFVFTISLCIPYAFIKVEEYKDKTMVRMHDEFSQLPDNELLDTFNRAHALPPGKQKGMFIAILDRELERRFGGNES